MLPLDTTLYFSSIPYNNYYHNDIWQNIYDECDYNGQFFLNISKRINPNRFVARNGEWSLPWKQELMPGFEMPEYDPNFSMSFSEVTDSKALSIKGMISQGKRFALMYSGGIDSTVILVSLLKNLTSDELQNIAICTSTHALIEHPMFYKKYVHGNFTILDSNKVKYDDLIEQGYIPITADEGDCIFGTVFGLTMYSNYDYLIEGLSTDIKTKLKNLKFSISDPNVHYSTYKDLISKHLSIEGDENFGRILYEKYHHNAQTSNVPVLSLHDFFWWLIFNVKYLNCSIRGALYFNDRIEWKTAIHSIVNWYNDTNYQLWSMANNNNGKKIALTASSYKTVAKDYIWEFDHNDWYRNFKPKLESMWHIAFQQKIEHIENDRRPVARTALTKDYEMLYINNPEVQNFYKYHLQNYKIDWTDT